MQASEKAKPEEELAGQLPMLGVKPSHRHNCEILCHHKTHTHPWHAPGWRQLSALGVLAAGALANMAGVAQAE
eukprot:1154272-Pelagomonas_calceolata.AAC.1